MTIEEVDLHDHQLKSSTFVAITKLDLHNLRLKELDLRANLLHELDLISYSKSSTSITKLDTHDQIPIG